MVRPSREEAASFLEDQEKYFRETFEYLSEGRKQGLDPLERLHNFRIWILDNYPEQAEIEIRSLSKEHRAAILNGINMQKKQEGQVSKQYELVEAIILHMGESYPKNKSNKCVEPLWNTSSKWWMVLSETLKMRKWKYTAIEDYVHDMQSSDEYTYRR